MVEGIVNNKKYFCIPKLFGLWLIVRFIVLTIRRSCKSRGSGLKIDKDTGLVLMRLKLISPQIINLPTTYKTCCNKIPTKF